MSNQIIPIPEVPVTVRPATLADLPFIDALQKKHSKMVGFMQRQALVGKINAGQVLVAQVARASSPCLGAREVETPCPTPSLDTGRMPVPLIGYIIGTDRYFKHDDVGIIYHLNVVPGKQRSFVGATLLKAMFDRAAYGCRLFCCWCAQDIEANRFWESMGFVPLAYRAGSRTRGQKSGVRGQKANAARIHIFWQKRIRGSDDAAAGWWFPAQTTGGAMRSDRIVLPIPPGKHWSDAMPVILPAGEITTEASGIIDGPRANTEITARKRISGPKTTGAAKPKSVAVSRVRKPVNAHGGLFFAAPASPAPLPASSASEPTAKPKRTPKPRAKNDPKLVAAARELRDRWLEHVNASGGLMSTGKYHVSRQLPRDGAPPPPLLAA